MKLKIAALGVIAVSLFVVLATTSAMTTLTHIGEPHPPHLTVDNLLTGQIYYVYRAAETWQLFPGQPSPIGRYFDYRALGIMSLLAGVIVWVGSRLRLGLCHPLIGAAFLLCAVVPYLIGRVVLADNTNLEAVGRWMDMMLLSILYGAVACALFTGAGLIHSRKIGDAP